MAEVVGRACCCSWPLVLQKGPPVGLYVGTMESCKGLLHAWLGTCGQAAIFGAYSGSYKQNFGACSGSY